MRTRVLCIALFLAVCSAAAAGAATPPRSALAGTWKGSYGGAFSGTFTLHWVQKGAKLSGTIHLSKPAGTYGITGSVRGTGIKFGAVDVGATYTGSVSGKSMSGKYKSPQGGGPWSATKS